MSNKKPNIKIPGFISDLDIRVVSQNNFKLLSPLSYVTKLLPKDQNIITVPTGYITNFASCIIVKFGEKSATTHDRLYDLKIKRSLADKIYLEALRSEGLPEWKCIGCYLGVRAAGWYWYNGYNK